MSMSVCMFVCLLVWLFVCLFVCLSVCLQTSKTTRPHFIQLSVHVICDHGSVLIGRQCDMLTTSGFVADVVFSYDAGNRPESKRTRMFRPVRQVAAPVERQHCLVEIARWRHRGQICILLVNCKLWICLFVQKLLSRHTHSLPIARRGPLLWDVCAAAASVQVGQVVADAESAHRHHRSHDGRARQPLLCTSHHHLHLRRHGHAGTHRYFCLHLYVE